MLHVVLVHPQIAGNAGNVIRLCANTGARLHLVEPLGFQMDEARLRRAGLDYHELADVQVHADWDACRTALRTRRLVGFSSRGSTRHDRFDWSDEDVLVFGAEQPGLPEHVLTEVHERVRIPMRPGNRSLNLANSVAISVFEAWRQLGFPGAVDGPLQPEDGHGLTAESTELPPFDR